MKTGTLGSKEMNGFYESKAAFKLASVPCHGGLIDFIFGMKKNMFFNTRSCFN